MKCPVCGGAELQHESRDIAYEYKGQKTIFHAVKGQFCDACDEIIFSNGEGDEYFAAILAFNRKVNAEEVDPTFIANVRKRLNLTNVRQPKFLAAESMLLVAMKQGVSRRHGH